IELGVILLALTNISISTELVKYIEQENLSISSFAHRAGINSGTLSRFINGQQRLSVSGLDLITKAMNLEEGYFYTAYVNESSLNWRRLGPFIMRCAELGKLECIAQTVDMMLDVQAYAPQLFDSAEALFHKGNLAAALIIYKKVAEAEKYQHSERLGWCQYRIFICSLNSDQENNLNCTIQFESYVQRLPEAVQLDALEDLTNTLLSLQKWDKAKFYAQEMGRISRLLYTLHHHKNSKSKKKSIPPKKPLFGYILYSDLILGSIAAEKSNYDEALYYVSCYENHSWIVESDAVSEGIKNKFTNWAKGNRYLYQLMSGNFQVIDEYMAYISSFDNEILRALFRIVHAAIVYHWNIDKYLEQYESIIREHYEQGCVVGDYNQQITNDRFARFLAEIGEYYINQGNIHKGTRYILDSLDVSYKINNTANIVKCCSTIEYIRHKIDPLDLLRYSQFMKEVNRNEKKVGKNS
ncbi:helix-turn-helix transcriptional regulator, partial [Paenibacillus campinasensis]|uniref:helix-turn-helix domain-containing protein n=1 Tax=Paenibacillus campinasensis TaxID=66347 RepID=UPI0031454ECA